MLGRDDLNVFISKAIHTKMKQTITRTISNFIFKTLGCLLCGTNAFIRKCSIGNMVVNLPECAVFQFSLHLQWCFHVIVAVSNLKLFAILYI